MPFEKSGSYLSLMIAHQEAVKWVSLDWSSLGKKVIKWGSFNKITIFTESQISKRNKYE